MKVLDTKDKAFLDECCRFIPMSDNELVEEYRRTPKRKNRPLEDYDRYEQFYEKGN